MRPGVDARRGERWRHTQFTLQSPKEISWIAVLDGHRPSVTPAAGQRIPPLFDFIIADRDRQNLNLAIANHGRGLVTFSRTRQIQRADCRRTRLEREPTLAGLRVRLRRRHGRSTDGLRLAHMATLCPGR
ncbi:uncharacterized protein CIMG_00350 [Coccidioides immitis RS]|uniref:Uncharacterized protein n=1 Tax=Coccidioides immitis (strain RS) TaxID=246410 RepID=J3KGT8_COCIM|nr:uncharacterized protein CIMG_00350 [Coccidioides immitis RS]EAS34996.3 hypothetical protein CIMG_00350 [Coccidioides immitis RS]